MMKAFEKYSTLAVAIVLFMLLPMRGIRAENISVELTPLANEDPEAVEYWELCFTADIELHRLTVGVQPPSSYGGPMEWVDCPDTVAPTQCSGAGAMVPYSTVRPEGSFAETENGTLFLVLEGNGGAADGALNEYNWEGSPVCVARLHFAGTMSDPPPANTDLPTLVSLDDEDLENLTYGTASGTLCDIPIILDGDRENANCGGGPGSLSQTVTVASTIPEDVDGDLRRDSEDNCQYKANFDQADNGGLETAVSDGIGDACQCGEGDGSGQIQSAESDLENMLIHLRGGEAAGFDVSRCSLANPTTCTIHDAALLDSALQSTATLDNVCDAHSPPSP